MIQKLVSMLRYFLAVYLTKILGTHFNCLSDTGLASCKYIGLASSHKQWVPSGTEPPIKPVLISNHKVCLRETTKNEFEMYLNKQHSQF